MVAGSIPCPAAKSARRRTRVPHERGGGRRQRTLPPIEQWDGEGGMQTEGGVQGEGGMQTEGGVYGDIAPVGIWIE